MNTFDLISPRIHWQPIFFCLLAILGSVLLLIGMNILIDLNPVQAAQPVAPTTSDFAVGIYTDVLNLDPALTSWDTNSMLVLSQIYDALTANQPGGQVPEPSLALSWTTSADELTWTFYLRDGISFHDGTLLDAEAVVFNIERWWDSTNPYHDGTFEIFQAMFGGFKDDPGCFLADVNAIGSNQVQMVLTKVYYPLPSILSTPAFSIASPAAIQAGTLSESPIGSGPFSLVEHTLGEAILLEANANYWGGAPQVSTLGFQIIPDDADRFAALQAGTIQAVGDLPDEYTLQAVDDPQLQMYWRPSALIGYLGMNSANTPLNDPLVRQAIAYAIDLPALLESYYTPGDQLASQLLPPAIWGRDPDLSVYNYDPALSISLLETAGYTDGFTTTLSYRNIFRLYLPIPPDAVEAISAYLGAVGIQATVIEYESGEFIQKWIDGELDLFMLGWGADFLHPDNFFTPILCDPNNMGFGPLDETLCDIAESAQAEPDLEAQLALYQVASRRVHDNLPLLPIVNPRNTLLLRDDVAGVRVSAMGMESYKDAYLVEAEQVIVDPETEGSLIYYDESSLPTILEIPDGSVSETVLLRFVVTETDSEPVGYDSAAHSFDLSAIDFGETVPGFTFLEPVSVTIYYAEADVFNLHEETLRLFYWDGSQWLDAATTCTPSSTYLRDLEVNRISLPICHLSTFGLFAEPQTRQFLPLVVRK